MKNTQELAETILDQLYTEVDDQEYPRRVFIERDNETGEKRWFSLKGMGVEYVRANIAQPILGAPDIITAARDLIISLDSEGYISQETCNLINQFERNLCALIDEPFSERADYIVALAMKGYACGELSTACARIEALTSALKLVKDHSELEDEVLDVVDAVLGNG